MSRLVLPQVKKMLSQIISHPPGGGTTYADTTLTRYTETISRQHNPALGSTYSKLRYNLPNGINSAAAANSAVDISNKAIETYLNFGLGSSNVQKYKTPMNDSLYPYNYSMTSFSQALISETGATLSSPLKLALDSFYVNFVSYAIADSSIINGKGTSIIDTKIASITNQTEKLILLSVVNFEKQSMNYWAINKTDWNNLAYSGGGASRPISPSEQAIKNAVWADAVGAAEGAIRGGLIGAAGGTMAIPLVGTVSGAAGGALVGMALDGVKASAAAGLEAMLQYWIGW